ncbi:IS66-like element accessory protein TnpA [Paraburkholderia sp. SIMBA_030]|uniref:IS66-like element accessory protein TnpA n=1 Tax=Paraburkholderia sp. SIMBA_030 TaxID=3085773 RepID=UPI00397E577D
MNENSADFLPLRVTGISADGKRSFDKRGKQRLIEACLQPGVSVAGMAIKAGVNANQLWRWISRHKARHAGATAVADTPEVPPPAFVPVVEVTDATAVVVPQQPEKPGALLPAPVRRESMPASQRPPLPSRLVAQLPNGVSLELECMGHDTALVKAMIDALRVR